MKTLKRALLPTISVILVLAAAAAAIAPRSIRPGKDGSGPRGIFVVDGSPVHDAGELRVHASNWGMIGSWPTSTMPFSSAPSAEWPAGSGVEYLFTAGIWIGGVVGGVAGVSTSAFQFEFRPSDDPRDIVYETAYGAPGGKRVPSPGADDDGDGVADEDILDGYDNDGDGLIDEDYAAISDQMLSRVFRDDIHAEVYPEHRPFHLAVREESYQFSHPDYDDFVGFTFWITNTGTEVIEDAYIGVFADGDAGHRSRPNYWEDDGAAFQGDIPVDHGLHGTQGYDFSYWYDLDGDGGQAPGFAGVVILDHPTDPAGLTAPQQVGVATWAAFSGNLSYAQGGDPTNDFERYEALSSGTIEAPLVVPRDHRSLVAVGPFAAIAPGETVPFSFALVVTPRNDFSHVQRAAEAYYGLWFDLDGDPGTGIEGREHQEHWYLPSQNPVPVAIRSFQPRVRDGAVHVTWDIWSDEGIAGFDLLRAAGSGDLRPLTDAMLPAEVHDYVDAAVEPGVTYNYQLVAHGAEGWTAMSPLVSASVPSAKLALRPNTPNPFADVTTVSFTLPERSTVTLSVYDVAGHRIATLFSGEKGAGVHEVQWSGVGEDGQRVSAGIYFCRIEAGKRLLTRKMMVIR